MKALLVRICGDAHPDAACSGRVGDLFAPAFAISRDAWVATCRDVDALVCDSHSSPRYVPAYSLGVHDLVYVLDEDQQFSALMLSAHVDKPSNAQVFEMPYGSHWPVVAVALSVLALAVAFRVVATWQRARALVRRGHVPASLRNL